MTRFRARTGRAARRPAHPAAPTALARKLHGLLKLILPAMLLAACGLGPEPPGTQPVARTEAVAATQPAPAATHTQPPAPTSTLEPTHTASPAPPTATPTPPAAGHPQPDCCELKPVITGLDKPVLLTHAGDARLFIVEQGGLIRIAENGSLRPQPFLDLSGLVTRAGNEQGLLGLAFHPDYAANGYFFVNYSDLNGDTVVARYAVSADPHLADPASAVVVLAVEQPYRNHNGGHLAFGPDGLLYIGLGDGGSAGDPLGNGQNPVTLLGKMLRLDVNAPGAQPEIWALGLRNPWRYSFDRLTGDLFIGDVGQGQREEISHVAAPLPAAGPNFGWNILEGTHRYSTVGDVAGLTGPVAEYSHAGGHCTVVGGYVYRGSAMPSLQGAYFFADYCSGQIWTLAPDPAGGFSLAEFIDTDALIASFGEDAAGELYLVDHRGSILLLSGQ